MTNVVSYDPNTLIAKHPTVSLKVGTEQLADWQHQQNGAYNFAYTTLMLAMRDCLGTEMQMPPETLTSVNLILEKYQTQLYGDSDIEQRNLYIIKQLKATAFRHTLSDALRAFAVRHHATGMTTAEVISLILETPHGEGLTPLRDYIHLFEAMKQPCRDYLSTQLNYLKRGHPRFPKKYNDLWHQARQEYLNEIQHIPLTHVSEQVAEMQQHYQKLKAAFDALPPDAKYTRDRERLTNAMNKTMSGLYTMTGEKNTHENAVESK